MLRLRRVARLCSSTLSDTANRLRNGRNGNPTAVPHFRSGRRSPIFAGLTNKGKVGVQRGRETAGVPSFLPPRRAPQSPALRRAHSPLRFSGKLPARQGRTRLRQFVRPGQPVQRKSAARQGRTRLRQFACPAGSVQRKVPPGQGEHANAVRTPRSAGAEKAAAPFERTACAVRVSRLTLRSYLTILRRQSMLSQQQNRRKYEPVHPCTLRSVPWH